MRMPNRMIHAKFRAIHSRQKQIQEEVLYRGCVKKMVNLVIDDEFSC